MKHLLPALVAVFLYLPFAYAQSPDLGTVDYLRHDARTGQTQWIELDAGCLADAGMPWMNNINLDPSKDSVDWERMLLLVGVNCMIRLQREDNRLQRESNQLQMDILDALTAE